MSWSKPRGATVWWALTIIVALIFLFVASSDAIYEATSPPGPFQILLRKSYSIAAFAIIGFLFSGALEASNKSRPGFFTALAIAAYSLVIEIVQALVGSHEGLGWNAIDVACGFVGGYLGAGLERLRPRG